MRRAAGRCGRSEMQIYGSRKRGQSLPAQSGFPLQSALAVTFCRVRVFDFLAMYPKTKVELRLTDDKLNLVENGIDLSIRTGNACQTPR